MTSKENKNNSQKNETTTTNFKSELEKANIIVDDVSLHNGNFRFSFSGPNFNYSCLFKSSLKGIASEECLVNNQKYKVGIKKFCELAKLSEKVAEELLMTRNNILKSIRGDESNVAKIEFEISELESKLEVYEDKIAKMKSKIEDKKFELEKVKEFESQNRIDTKELQMKAKQNKIEELKKQLEALES